MFFFKWFYVSLSEVWIMPELLRDGIFLASFFKDIFTWTNLHQPEGHRGNYILSYVAGVGWPGWKSPGLTGLFPDQIYLNLIVFNWYIRIKEITWIFFHTCLQTFSIFWVTDSPRHKAVCRGGGSPLNTGWSSHKQLVRNSEQRLCLHYNVSNL